MHENTVTNELICLRAISKSHSSSDRIGDLGDLSDFTDTGDMTENLKNEIEIDHFVDIADKTAPNQIKKLHILSKSNEVVSNLTFVDISDMYIDIDAQHSIFNILCNDLCSLTRSESMDTNDIESNESNQYLSLNSHKILSQFKPENFEICLLTSAPLMIENSANLNIGSNLEYLRHSLPNRREIEQSLTETLRESECNVSYAHFALSESNLQRIVSLGGAKLLIIVGLCVNPVKDCRSYPRMCGLCPFADNCDYILLQTRKDLREYKWRKCEELAMDRLKCDILVCVSPMHARLCRVFKSFGFGDIIGVESAMNCAPFAQSECEIFLRHLWNGLLHSGSVSHSFHLSVQASIANLKNGKNDFETKFLFLNARPTQQRYIVFSDMKYENKLSKFDKSELSYTQNTNLCESVRPFIGRGQYVIELSNAVMNGKQRIVNGIKYKNNA